MELSYFTDYSHLFGVVDVFFASMILWCWIKRKKIDGMLILAVFFAVLDLALIELGK